MGQQLKNTSPAQLRLPVVPLPLGRPEIVLVAFDSYDAVHTVVVGAVCHTSRLEHQQIRLFVGRFFCLPRLAPYIIEWILNHLVCASVLW